MNDLGNLSVSEHSHVYNIEIKFSQYARKLECPVSSYSIIFYRTAYSCEHFMEAQRFMR